MSVEMEFILKSEIKTEEYEDYHFHVEEVSRDEAKRVEIPESKVDLTIKREYKIEPPEKVGILLFYSKVSLFETKCKYMYEIV